MATPPLALVTGANGHLGYNLVKLLLEKGIPVRASVRNPQQQPQLFAALDCEVVQADITNKASLLNALQSVEVLYAVGAAFKLWAKDPRKEIYRDMYYNSKNDVEKLAFELAKQYKLDLVAVLPSAMIGSEIPGPLSVSYNIIDLILKKQVPIETHITLNWIDVKDVAEACFLAANHGKAGERYIIANEKSISRRESTRIAQQLFPERNIKLPIAVPKPMLYFFAYLLELGSKISGKAPLLSVKDIAMFSGLKQDFDISKAQAELGFKPKKPEQALQEAMLYLQDRQGA